MLGLSCLTLGIKKPVLDEDPHTSLSLSLSVTLDFHPQFRLISLLDEAKYLISLISPQGTFAYIEMSRVFFSKQEENTETRYQGEKASHRSFSQQHLRIVEVSRHLKYHFYTLPL